MHPSKTHYDKAFREHILLRIPKAMLQYILARIVRRIARTRPNLFNRIGPHKDKRFLIEPNNLPFSFILQPNPDCPMLKAVNKVADIHYDAKVSGSFLTLFDMIDGQLDGDALFFSRRIIIEGDTEAVVCLRNALDDLEGSIAEDIAAMFRSPGRILLTNLRKYRGYIINE
jgi:predicted lipid carrier protein YhbT